MDPYREAPIGVSTPSSPDGDVVRGLGWQPALEGVRGLAVLLVMAYHFGLPMAEGSIGVDVFFALSGFLITSLLLAERDKTGTISFRSFYARRGRRLLPALILVLALFVVVHHFGFMPLTIPTWSALLFPLFFASNFLAMLKGLPPLNALNPTWSLAVEEQFYLLWPLALWLLVRRRVRPFVMIGGLAVVGFALAYVAHKIPVYYPHWDLYFNPLDRMAQLLLGCMGAFMYRYRLVPRVLRWRPLGWLALVALVAVAYHDQPTVSGALHLAPWSDIQITYFAATALAFLIIINLVENRDSDLAAFFRIAPLRYIGKISYGLYLVNLPIIAVLRPLMPDRTDYFRAPIAMAVALALATASWYLVERPILRTGRRSVPPSTADPAADIRPAAPDARPPVDTGADTAAGSDGDRPGGERMAVGAHGPAAEM